MTNFGFAVPAGETIKGIQAVFTVLSNYTDDFLGNDRYIMDNTIQLYKAGVLTGSIKTIAGNWPTTQGTRSYGGLTDLWGKTWTFTDVNNSRFRIRISAAVHNDWTKSGANTNVSPLAITVYYTA